MKKTPIYNSIIYDFDLEFYEDFCGYVRGSKMPKCLQRPYLAINFILAFFVNLARGIGYLIMAGIALLVIGLIVITPLYAMVATLFGLPL